MKSQLYILSMILAGSALAGSTLLSEPRFEVSCEVELHHGGTPKVLTKKSPPFAAGNFGSETGVLMSVGPYTLRSEIAMMGKEHFTMRPHLTLNLFEGNPVSKSIFYATMDGFDVAKLRNPLTITGFQFRELTHEGTRYTRVDYSCAVQPVP